MANDTRLADAFQRLHGDKDLARRFTEDPSGVLQELGVDPDTVTITPVDPDAVNFTPVTSAGNAGNPYAAAACATIGVSFLCATVGAS